jgi:hypothetical protein
LAPTPSPDRSAEVGVARRSPVTLLHDSPGAKDATAIAMADIGTPPKTGQASQLQIDASIEPVFFMADVK